MKKTIKVLSLNFALLLVVVATVACVPQSFDIDGTATAVRRAGFSYRNLSGEKATGNYFTDEFTNNFSSQDFYNYQYVQSKNYEFYENYRAPKETAHTQAINAVANAAGSFLEFWNDNDGKKQYILMFECKTESVAEQVYGLLQVGVNLGYSWVLQQNIPIKQSGSVVVLYTSNAAKYVK